MTVTDLQLLIQLGTVDNIECVALTDADHVAGGIPRWAEVRLDIERDGKLLQHYLTRHDGEAISLALLRSMHPNAGRSISGHLWEGLDQCMVNLMEGGLSGEDKAAEKGLALGLATAIALIRSPHAPDVDAVRKEARERYDAME
jgi:hypothetical protein